MRLPMPNIFPLFAVFFAFLMFPTGKVSVRFLFFIIFTRKLRRKKERIIRLSIRHGPSPNNE